MADYTVTLEELRSFHEVDRALFVILVRDLYRLPFECLYIMGLWLWLERGGFSSLVTKILHLPPFFINELADEAMAILGCMNSKLFPNPPESAEILLTDSFGPRDISLQFFRQNRLIAFDEIQRLVSTVCLPSMSDIVLNGPPGFAYRPNQALIMDPGYIANQARAPMQRNSTALESGEASSSRGEQPRRRNEFSLEMDRNNRTMFVTFSKGYPVSEEEVRQFFSDGLGGNCIEEFYMQEVRRNEQALYARIVFTKPSFIDTILKGYAKVKFTINGKHVWMRKFVPKENNRAPCGCLRSVNCNC